MSRLLTIAVIAAAAAIPDGSWLLGYAGRPTSAAVNDRRFTPVVRSRLPSALVGRMLANLGGPPDSIVVVDGRFVSMSGCRAPDCQAKGMFWIDAKSGEAIGAAYASSSRNHDVLTIGSKGISATMLPAEAMASIVAWLTRNDLDPDIVEFIGPSNLPVTVKAEPFRPRARDR